jgi:hypothetical protein
LPHRENAPTNTPTLAPTPIVRTQKLIALVRQRTILAIFQ